jgi:plastocyanin
MNKKLIVVLVTVVVIAGGVWAYFAMQPNASAPQNETKNTNTNSTDTQSNTSTSNEITYTDNGFSPDNLTVKVGSTITIKNQSSGPLQFSSDDHPTHTKDPELNLSAISAGGEQTLKLTKAGAWGFHNHLKASDSGTITATE